MDKMRQFSFQDHVTSKQSEATLDSINSPLSSCNNRNFGQELQDSKALNNMQNFLNVQSPLKDSNVSPKHALSARQRREEKENVPTELGKENNFPSSQTKMPEFSGTTLEDRKAILQEKWKNDFKENENHLRENWKKINKINKLLAEHKKKKASRLGHSPLKKLNENGALQEIDQNIQQSPIITENKRKGNRSNIPLQDGDYSSQQDTEPFEVYDESYSYEFFNERPEQVFSAALNEPFSPAVTQSLAATKPNHGLKNHPKQTRSSQNSSKVGEEAPVVELNAKDSPESRQSENLYVETPASKLLTETEPQSKKKTSEKKLPIEERLRLKEIEREMKLTYLREERARNLMKQMKDKPQISENSLKIAKNSRRARENEQVLERLSASGSKKALLLGTPKYTESSEYHNQSKMSHGVVTHGRNTHEEKSLGGEVDSNINLYKKNNRQSSITGSNQSPNHFELYRQATDGPDQLDSLQRSENSQQVYPSKPFKEMSSIEPAESLEGYPSDNNSLQKQASDRLIQAMAKKGISQSSGISPLSVKPGEFYKSESSVPLSPMSVYPPSGIEKKKEVQDSYRDNTDYEQDMPAYGSVHTEQASVTSLRTPKHIYLSIPKDMLEEKSKQEKLSSSKKRSRNIPDQEFRPSDLYDNEGDNLRSHGMNNREDNEQVHNSDYYGETKKRSTRQPTFGCSPAKKGTNHSSKLASHDLPAEMVTGGFNSKNSSKENDYNNADQNIEASSRSSIGRPSNESLMNSLKLRQQRFGLQLRDPNQGDDKPWPDIDVYMRNSMWLSAKNSKVAAMNVMKENQEMKECTFHPHLTDKYNGSRSIFKSASKMISERGKDQVGKQKKGVSSYKDLYSHKLRTFDQQQTASITSPSNYVEQDYTSENEILEEVPANVGQQEE